MSESGQSKPPTAVRITDPRNTWSKPLNTGRFLSPFIDTIDAVVLNFQSTGDFPSRDVNPDVARPVSNDKRLRPRIECHKVLSSASQKGTETAERNHPSRVVAFALPKATDNNSKRGGGKPHTYSGLLLPCPDRDDHLAGVVGFLRCCHRGQCGTA
jgi:hypothetical protein